MKWLVLVALMMLGAVGLLMLWRPKPRSHERCDEGHHQVVASGAVAADGGATRHEVRAGPTGDALMVDEEPAKLIGPVPEEGTVIVEPPTEPSQDGSHRRARGQGSDVKSKRVRPQKRGGRPRRSDGEDGQRGRPGARARLYIAFRCLWIDGEWYVGLTVDRDGQEGAVHVDKTGITITQDGQALAYDHHHESWILRSLEPVQIAFATGYRRQVDARSSQEPVVIFRLAQSGREGPVVRAPSVGLFGFIVPEDWQLESDNPTPIEDERAHYRGYVVRFVEVGEGRDSRVVFRTPDGESKAFAMRRPAWDLEGKRAPDGSKRVGPLYFGAPPRLRCAQPGSPVVSAVVGQEGPAANAGSRWRAIVDLTDPAEAADAIATALKGAPPQVREAGWFYVRLYDDHEQLVESFDFRYAEGIEDVDFQHDPWAHGEHVQPSVLTVRLLEGWQLDVRDQALVSSVRWQASQGVVRLEIDPQVAHVVHLPLEIWSPHGGTVQWHLPLSKVAWAIAREPGGPEAWLRTPVLLRRDDYKPTSQSYLKVSVPGYLEPTARLSLLLENNAIGEYRPKENVFTIPLKHLFDAVEARRVPTLCIKARLTPVGRQMTVAIIRRRFRCPHCPHHVEPDLDRALQHILDHHILKYLTPLRYEEIAARHGLPSKIYLCIYCGFYVPADDRLLNPNSTIAEHQEKSCAKARQAAGQNWRTVKVQFRVVGNADEVREHIMKTLPKEFKCAECGAVLTFSHDSDPQPGLRRHLVAHQDILVDQVTMEDEVPSRGVEIR